MNPSQPTDSPKSCSELLGRTVLVGITRVDPENKVLSQEQFHGVVESLADELVHIRVAGNGADFTLFPEPTAFARAKPGHYRLRSTGEVVVDPDFTTSLTVRAPASRWQRRISRPSVGSGDDR
ncbi:MAG: hypothetical protein U1G08_09575 [Verrucomicrobiota bacterium]